MSSAQQTAQVYLLLGTERGFCGDFNQALVRLLDSVQQTHPVDNAMLISIGHKLNTLLAGDERLVASLEGAAVAEEVTPMLNRIVNELTALQQRHGVLAVYCLYHRGGDNGIVMQQVLPPFQVQLRGSPRFAHAPQLNLPPRHFLVELTEHYLFAVLHELLYISLMAENHHRITHLDGAVRHLDDESQKLARQCNSLRQEEIIEEIEVILLSSVSLGQQP